jgi:acetyl-CoA acetyltransferase
VRADDLAALPIAALMARNPGVDWARGRRLRLRQPGRRGQPQRGPHGGAAGRLPVEVPGSTINRLCGSSLDAVGMAARAIKSGEAQLMIAGGVESMSRALRDGQGRQRFSRSAKIDDTTIGWRFVNPLMKAQYGIDSMPETAENVAQDFGISRADQDAFALRSQQRWAAAHAAGVFRDEIVPVTLAQRRATEDRRHRRASAPGHHAGDAGQAERRGAAGWHGHGRQCVGRERRRLRDAAGLRGGGRTVWPAQAGARAGHGHGGWRRASWASARRRRRRRCWRSWG